MSEKSYIAGKELAQKISDSEREFLCKIAEVFFESNDTEKGEFDEIDFLFGIRETEQINKNDHILTVGKMNKIRTHSAVGGYPIFYLTADDSVFCADCVQDRLSRCTDPDDRFFVTAHAVNYEDPDLYCDLCSDRIESAYAESEGDCV
jgi:hypothetical protein